MTDPDEFDLGELGQDAPEADAFEQGLAADPSLQPDQVHRGLEVDDADALDQARVVELDDEER